MCAVGTGYCHGLLSCSRLVLQTQLYPWLDLYIPAPYPLPEEHYTSCWQYGHKECKQPCHQCQYAKNPFYHWVDMWPMSSKAQGMSRTGHLCSGVLQSELYIQVPIMHHIYFIQLQNWFHYFWQVSLNHFMDEPYVANKFLVWWRTMWSHEDKRSLVPPLSTH